MSIDSELKSKHTSFLPLFIYLAFFCLFSSLYLSIFLSSSSRNLLNCKCRRFCQTWASQVLLPLVAWLCHLAPCEHKDAIKIHDIHTYWVMSGALHHVAYHPSPIVRLPRIWIRISLTSHSYTTRLWHNSSHIKSFSTPKGFFCMFISIALMRILAPLRFSMDSKAH